MDGGALNRLGQLRACTALVEKGDAATLGRRLADMAECLARQQLLLEPHQPPASPSADLSRPAAAGAASGLSAQLAAAQQQQQQGATQTVASVNAWVASVQKLLNRTQTQATGALLLGATAACCSLGRLAASFAAWGTALSDLLRKEQAQGKPRQDVQRACFVALAQMLIRLQEVAHVEGVRRDGSPLASRAVAAALSLLGGGPAGHGSRQGQGQGQDGGPRAAASSHIPDAVALPALEVIFAVLTTLPTSLRQQTTNLEVTLGALAAGRSRGAGNAPASGTAGAALEVAAATAGSSGAVRQAAARCLALLPRVQGTADAWSGLARRALVSLADATDAAFMRLGDETLAARAREQLGAGGDGVLGALPTIHTSVAEGGALKQLRPALDTLAAALTLVEQLLAAPFPVPVPLPGQAVLFAVHRLLRLDEGAVLAAGRVPPSTGMFGELCAAMPAVREAAWQLLARVLTVAGPSLCPHHAAAGIAVVEALRRQRARGPAALAAATASERTAMYRCAAALVVHGGVAAGRQLAGEALSAAGVEFFGAAAPPDDAGGVSIGVQGAAGPGFGGAQGQRSAKRQKQGGSAAAGGGGAAEAAESAAAAVAAGAPDGGAPQELGATAEATAMLMAILQVVGPLLPAATRAKYDALACHMATCASDAATAASRDPRCSGPQAAAVKVLQRQALELLLTSVLAPCRHRPPYLGQALCLFKQGRSDSCPAVASFCTAALLSCEGLLHPRSLPMTGLQQYAGLQEVAPLVKPRMWSVLDPVVAQPPPTMLAPAQPDAGPQPAAAAATAVTAAPAAAPVVSPAPAPAPAAAALKSVAGTKRPLEPLLPLKQQQQQRQTASERRAAAQAGAAPAAAAPQALPAAAAAASASHAPAAGAAPAAAPAPAAAAAAAAPSAFVDAEESSDSEGSLPDIDSGDDDGDDM